MAQGRQPRRGAHSVIDAWGVSWGAPSAWSVSWSREPAPVSAFDPGARKPRRRKPEFYKLHPEEILRQQKMTQDYLDELERRKAPPPATVVKGRVVASPRPRPSPVPRLTAAMAHAATMQQLRAIVTAKLATERDRARAKQEQERRRRLGLAVLLLTH